MRRLLLFLLKYRAFIVFLILEALCFWLIVQNNHYQSAAFFNSSNQLAASTMSTTHDVKEYFSLKKVNHDLVEENARLRQLLEQKGEILELDETDLKSDVVDTTEIVLEPDSTMVLVQVADSTMTLVQVADSTMLLVQVADSADTISPQYTFLSAQVINNSTQRFHNFLTIDRGLNDGIEAGDGVISLNGVVGKIKSASGRFATVTSLLNTNMLISSLITSSNTFCSVKWDGYDPLYGNVLYVPRHIEVNLGDTVTTSGFNSIFPEDILIGTISDIDISENATFYELEMKLSTDFSNLSFVYVIKNQLRQEKDSLEQATTLTE